MISLTLRELAEKSGVSASHLTRIEKGNRSPSAHVLKNIAQPLVFDESELLALAGYLPPQPYTGDIGRLDPYVASVLASEPVAIQHTVIGILAILKSIARSIEARDMPCQYQQSIGDDSAQGNTGGG